MDHGIRNPLKLEFAPHGIDGREMALTAMDAKGNMVIIVASRERFSEAILHPSEHPAAIARRMFERDEIDVETFERSLDRRF